MNIDLNTKTSHAFRIRPVGLTGPKVQTICTTAVVRIPKLDGNSLRVVNHCDAVFSYNADLSLQLGRMIILAEKNTKALLISYESYK